MAARQGWPRGSPSRVSPVHLLFQRPQMSAWDVVNASPSFPSHDGFLGTLFVGAIALLRKLLASSVGHLNLLKEGCRDTTPLANRRPHCWRGVEAVLFPLLVCPCQGSTDGSSSWPDRAPLNRGPHTRAPALCS